MIRPCNLVYVCFALGMSACSNEAFTAAGHDPAGYASAQQMKKINEAYATRDACLSRNTVPFSGNGTSAETIARNAARACQSETDALIVLQKGHRDPNVADAIRQDSEFRALGLILKARGQGWHSSG